MKRELALQLLQTILPSLTDEGATARLFNDLQFMAGYKYNKYEMYHPGRLFLENLYLWLQQFAESERASAIDFVRHNLIFVSRQEFQQLAGILYMDRIRMTQLDAAAVAGGHPRHEVRVICESADFRRVCRASLYVALSDGARIDYIRRHNLEISNEQVLPYYETSEEKINDLLRQLRNDTGDSSAHFSSLFLLDDFCGSGRTLLREVVVSSLPAELVPPVVPDTWASKLRFNQQTRDLELLYEGELSASAKASLLQIGSGEAYTAALDVLFEKVTKRTTFLKGALSKIANGTLRSCLAPDAKVYLCPLLATRYAVDRLQPLFSNLPSPFARTQMLPGAILEPNVAINTVTIPVGILCDKYYREEYGDHHTGSVKFGFDNCGLPLVLHHNTPNNSIYLLWVRKAGFNPLFIRYERHGREGVT